MSDPADRQLDLFAATRFRPEPEPTETVGQAPPVPTEMTDAALLAAIPLARSADCAALITEAARRQLPGAVAALEALCRRFKGFGVDHAIREQTEALEGLAAIRCREAGQAVARLIVGQIVQGPGLQTAMAAAASLGSALPGSLVVSLLRHDLPAIRTDACRCARQAPETIAVLIELLDDLNSNVARSAACALGRMARTEASAPLARLLARDPTTEAIEAIAAIADEDCLILLRRIALARPDLKHAVLAALDDTEQPRATQIAEAIRAT